MIDDDFDWSGASVVVRSYGDLAVYANPHGDVVIRQHGGATQDDDQWVAIPLSQVETIIAAMRELVRRND